MREEDIQKVSEIRDKVNDVLAELEEILHKHVDAASDENLDSCLFLYKVTRDIVGAVEGIQKSTKLQLSEAMAWKGISEFHSENGRAYVSKPSVYSKYDAKALDALIESSDEYAKILAPHREIKERAGVLYIK